MCIYYTQSLVANKPECRGGMNASFTIAEASFAKLSHATIQLFPYYTPQLYIHVHLVEVSLW